jgi:hypothetical protein
MSGAHSNPGMSGPIQKPNSLCKLCRAQATYVNVGCRKGAKLLSRGNPSLGTTERCASERISQHVYERCGAKYPRLSRAPPMGVGSAHRGLERNGGPPLSPSSSTPLASGHLTANGDELIIEIVETKGQESVIAIRWPGRPTVTSLAEYHAMARWQCGCSPTRVFASPA